MIERARIWRPLKGRLELWTPYRPANRQWLKDTLGARPTWSGGRWLVARRHLHLLAQAAADRFGECEVWTDHLTTERCHVKCQQAKGAECVCSCLGRYHGGGTMLAGWVEFGDSGAIVASEIARAHWLVTR
jgi:hypothetical protein